MTRTREPVKSVVYPSSTWRAQRNFLMVSSTRRMKKRWN
jgi:hypothetical protein